MAKFIRAEANCNNGSDDEDEGYLKEIERVERYTKFIAKEGRVSRGSSRSFYRRFDNGLQGSTSDQGKVLFYI